MKGLQVGTVRNPMKCLLWFLIPWVVTVTIKGNDLSSRSYLSLTQKTTHYIYIMNGLVVPYLATKQNLGPIYLACALLGVLIFWATHLCFKAGKKSHAD